MTLDEQADYLESHVKSLKDPPEELLRIVKTMRFLAKPNIQQAIREEHQAEMLLKQAGPGAERVK